MRDLSTTTAADIAVGLISTLWDFADEELNLQLDADPTYGMKRVHIGSREHEPWPQELIEDLCLRQNHRCVLPCAWRSQQDCADPIWSG